jgi:hypothetical protein
MDNVWRTYGFAPYAMGRHAPVTMFGESPAAGRQAATPD